jgi:hypothetical protein
LLQIRCNVWCKFFSWQPHSFVQLFPQHIVYYTKKHARKCSKSTKNSCNWGVTFAGEIFAKMIAVQNHFHVQRSRQKDSRVRKEEERTRWTRYDHCNGMHSNIMVEKSLQILKPEELNWCDILVGILDDSNGSFEWLVRALSGLRITDKKMRRIVERGFQVCVSQFEEAENLWNSVRTVDKMWSNSPVAWASERSELMTESVSSVFTYTDIALWTRSRNLFVELLLLALSNSASCLL